MVEPKHSDYRAIHQLRHGGLHRALNVPENENIPHSRLEEEEKEQHPTHVKSMISFAKRHHELNKK